MSTSRPFGAVARLAASQHGVVTRSQAALEKIDRHQVARWKQRGLWDEVAPRVLVLAGAPDTWLRRASTAVLAAEGGGVVSHGAAARLHGVEGFTDHARVAVTVRRGARVPVPDVDVHRVKAWPLDPADLDTVEGLACTGLARTVVDLAASVDAPTLERALDHVERAGRSLGWLEWTAKRLHRPGQRGTGRVLAEVARRRTRGRVRGSWFQKLVAECLTSPLIPGLVEEYEVRDEQGGLVARVDLAVPCVRLAVEAHSRAFHTGAAVEAYDQRRDNRLAELGWDVRYVGWGDATQTPSAVRGFIERHVARRASDLGIVLPPGSPPRHGGR